LNNPQHNPKRKRFGFTTTMGFAVAPFYVVIPSSTAVATQQEQINSNATSYQGTTSSFSLNALSLNKLKQEAVCTNYKQHPNKWCFQSSQSIIKQRIIKYRLEIRDIIIMLEYNTSNNASKVLENRCS
jgi:hypothetical protein